MSFDSLFTAFSSFRFQERIIAVNWILELRVGFILPASDRLNPSRSVFDHVFTLSQQAGDPLWGSISLLRCPYYVCVAVTCTVHIFLVIIGRDYSTLLCGRGFVVLPLAQSTLGHVDA